MNLATIIKNCVLSDWEETSRAYCKLVLMKAQGGGRAVVLCGDREWEQSAIKRILSHYDICIDTVYTKSMLKSGKYTMAQIANVPAQTAIVSTIDALSALKRRGIIERGINKFFKNPEVEAAKEVNRRALMIHLPYWRERREEIYLYAKAHVKELQMLLDELGDELSRKTLCEIIRCSAENDSYRLYEGHQEKKYWECYEHSENEVWVNCGSAVGDTILKYLSCNNRFEKIYAYEGSESEFDGLVQTIACLPEELRSKIECRNCFIGLENSAENFDHIFADIPVSLINMDIEGAEMGVLRGAQQLIKRCRPVLAVCAYHKASDLLDIPNFIKETADDYVIFMRKYRGYEPNALNEYVYYLVPKERLLRCD